MVYTIDDLKALVDLFYTTIQAKYEDTAEQAYNMALFGKGEYYEKYMYINWLLPYLIKKHYEKEADIANGLVYADSHYVPDCVRKFYQCLGIRITNVISAMLA